MFHVDIGLGSARRTAPVTQYSIGNRSTSLVFFGILLTAVESESFESVGVCFVSSEIF